MELAPSGVLLTFEVTYDANDLDVAMSVYDTTNSPTLVAGPTAMTHLVANTYFGTFIPVVDHAYVIFKAVYTDDTFATLDTDYAAGTESIIAENISGGGGSSAYSGCPVIGFVIPSPTVIGFVAC